MSSRDSRIVAGTFDPSKQAAWQAWYDGYQAAIADLAAVAAAVAGRIKDTTQDSEGTTLNDPDGFLPGDGDRLQTAFDGVNAFLEVPPTGFTAWGYSHEKRRVKKVESRQ
jgi:hypothetical protein